MARGAHRAGANPARLVIALSVASVLAVFLLYTSIAGGGNPSVSPSELAGHEAMVPSFMRELTFQTRCGADGAPVESFTLERPLAALSTVHTDTLYAAALAGMVITGLPSFVAEEALLEHALERVLPCWHLLSTTIYAGMPSRKHVPARTRVFIDFLVEVFGGEDRDPWLLAAGCETLPSAPAAKAGRKKAALAVA